MLRSQRRAKQWRGEAARTQGGRGTNERCARITWHVGVAENAIQGKVGQLPCPRVMAAEGNRSGQALTGVGVGQVLSFEKCHLSGADGMPILGKQYPPWRQWQVMLEPGGVKDPEHAPLYNMHGTWEIPDNL